MISACTSQLSSGTCWSRLCLSACNLRLCFVRASIWRRKKYILHSKLKFGNDTNSLSSSCSVLRSVCAVISRSSQSYENITTDFNAYVVYLNFCCFVGGKSCVWFQVIDTFASLQFGSLHLMNLLDVTTENIHDSQHRALFLQYFFLTFDFAIFLS